MSEVNLGSIRTPGSFFLSTRTQAAPFEPHEDVPSLYRHCFTYRGSRESIREEAVHLINAAQHKLFVASFRIGDAKVLKALFEAVERLHGRVYVITSWTERTLSDGLAQIEEDDEADIALQKKRFDDLTRRGIYVRGHEQCHAKFIVADNSSALVSSANLETSALSDEGKPATGESGVVITDPVEVDRLGRFFTRLWHEGCTWQAAPGAEYALQKRTPTPSPASVAQSRQWPSVIWTDGPEQGIRGALHETIDAAEREILLATFGLVGIRKRPELLLEPLERAINRRNIAVHLLVRGRNQMPEHRADAAALADVGVQVHADYKTHVKAVIADGRYGALFSANFDADHGIYNGVEVGVRLDGHTALAEAHRYLRHCMEHADSHLVASPTQRELDARLSASWQHRWPSHRAKISLRADEATWHSLRQHTHRGPVLWEDRGEVIVLLAGNHEFAIDTSAGELALLPAAQAPLSAEERMHRWYGQRGERRNSPHRGVCPALLTRLTGS